MLVLSRKVGEALMIGDDVRVIVNRISGNRVSLAIEAPSKIAVVRGELKGNPNHAIRREEDQQDETQTTKDE